MPASSESKEGDVSGAERRVGDRTAAEVRFGVVPVGLLTEAFFRLLVDPAPHLGHLLGIGGVLCGFLRVVFARLLKAEKEFPEFSPVASLTIRRRDAKLVGREANEFGSQVVADQASADWQPRLPRGPC